MTWVRRLLLPGLPLAILGCPSEPSAPPPPPPPPPAPTVASVSVTLASDALTIGQTTQATAAARSATNQPIPGLPVSWSSSVAGVVTVSASGLVTAVAAGSAEIVATIAEISGSAPVQVFSAPPNLALTNLYLTQAVQRFEGGVPLVVDGHPVLLNLFGTLDRGFGTGAPIPRVRIEVFSGANLVLTDENPMSGIPATTVNPASPLHQVVLPVAIVQPGLRVRATINPANQPNEATLSDNTWPGSGVPWPIPVQQLPPLPLHFVPVLLTTGGSTGNVSPEVLPEYLTATNQMHPVSTVEADIGPVFATDVDFGSGAQPAWVAILQQLDLLRVAEGSARYYIGALRPPPGITFVQFGGFGYIPQNPQSIGPNTRTSVVVGVGWFNRARQTTELVAHELGHNQGRRHAPCGGAASPDPGFPYAGGATGLFGHDLFSWSQTPNPSGSPVSFPPTSGDIMSYCIPPWVSDYTYLGLLAARGGPVATPPGSPAPDPGSLTCDCLVVWGSVEEGRVRLEPAFVVPAPARPSLPPAGSLTLEGLAETGDRLFGMSFEPTEIDHAPGVRHFTIAIPLALTGGSALSRLRVMGEGAVAERRAPSAEPRVPSPEPPVTAQRSGADRLTLRWNQAEFPLLIARQAGTGRIVGIGRSGTLTVPSAAVDITVSNGVRSSSLRINPR